MIKITVPATSANLGPGFDALGLALTLYNEVWMEECDTVDIAAVDDTVIPTGTDNMILADMQEEPLKMERNSRIFISQLAKMILYVMLCVKTGMH